MCSLAASARAPRPPLQGARLHYDQWLDLLVEGHGATRGVAGYTAGGQVGTWSIRQDSEVTSDVRCRREWHASLTLVQAKAAFHDAQAPAQLAIGQMRHGAERTTLDYDELVECLARCALAKYAPLLGATRTELHADGPYGQLGGQAHEHGGHEAPTGGHEAPSAEGGVEETRLMGESRLMDGAAALTSFVRNLFGEETTEESLHRATLLRAARFDWRSCSVPLEGEGAKAHRRWLDVWRRLELTDVAGFPLWERGVHDTLHARFGALRSIFLAYARSAVAADSAEDAFEMEMAEFKHFVDECGLETPYVPFAWMQNTL